MGQPAQAQDDPAFQHGTPEFQVSSTDDCGIVEVTFMNPTPWLMVFDIRVDNEDSLNPPIAEGVEIEEGPLAGELFGDRWSLIEVDGRIAQHQVIQTFEFEESVEIRLAEGAEQKLFFDWQAVDVSEMMCITPTESPTEAPTSAPTTTPAPDCVDVNVDDEEMLRELNAVDEKIAAQILDLRPFSSTQDIVDRVKGIGSVNINALIQGGEGHLPLCELESETLVPIAQDGLPVTGSRTSLLVGIGAAAVVAGGAIMSVYYVSRARRLRRLENGTNG